jgi:hypothetical protein
MPFFAFPKKCSTDDEEEDKRIFMMRMDKSEEIRIEYDCDCIAGWALVDTCCAESYCPKSILNLRNIKVRECNEWVRG